ncbi:MAG: glycosyltransferase family 2 protein [Deltaproteobacteria bacterium]|nr:glycosyltransferase family 2 protein [Deltaproteobacteria bacterium]
MVEQEIEVSIVLPCLNEEATLALCVRAAKAALAGAGISGEIVVADNGSTDGSREIAKAEGARVVEVAAKGYGNALFHGFTEAKGRYLVHLDADMSYEFGHIPLFVEELRKGADLVMGSRIRGNIDRGAMPILHRYLGTPVLTTLANFFFHCGITDINCGMRGLRKETFERLGLCSGGMEFASEMVVKSALLGAKIVDIPTDLHCDQRDHAPHLSSFRDGWRHLRFLLLFCPTWLFLWPGAVTALSGIAIITAILFDLFPKFGLLTCLVGLSATVFGVQTMLLGLAARSFSQLRRLRRGGGVGDRFFSALTLEKGLASGGGLVAIGLILLGVAGVRIFQFMSMDNYNPGQLDIPSTKLALLGSALFVSGAQVVSSSFFLSLFSIEPVTHNTDARGAGDVSLNLNLGSPEPVVDTLRELPPTHRVS